VFPSFLFMVGIAVVYSIEARLAKGETKKTLMLHTVQRAVVLFCFGLIVNAFPHFHLASWRIYGVLQRIAICSLVVSALYLYSRRVASFVALVAVALVGYYIIMRWISIPGFGMPARDVPLLDMDKNWVAYLDRSLMPAARLYQKVRDPEGLLSTLPALGTAGLGVLTGFWLRSARSGMVKAGGLLAGAVVGIASGELWNVWFPINKKMWTSSYVLFAGGCTLLVLAVCYFMFDVKRLRKEWGYPWLVFGSNAITAYMVSELLAATLGSIHLTCGGSMTNLQRCIFRSAFQNVGSPGFGSLLYSLAYVAVCFIPNLILYRKKIFLKV
jgi:predicted acyltransferase